MIHVVIPIFNARKHLQACLESLRAQVYRDFRVIIVDDGSRDGSAEFIREKFPETRIVTGTGDWWWARSMNEGIQSVLAECGPEDCVLSLNVDLFVEPDYLARLAECEARFRPCLVGSVSVDQAQPGIPIFAGVRWNPWTAKYKVATRPEPIRENGGTYFPTAMLPGRGTLIPIAALRKVGLYHDRRFPQYAADDDLSLRAKKAGFRLLVCPDARVHSNVSSTGANFKISGDLSPARFWGSLWSLRSPFYLKARFRFSLAHGRIGPLYFAFDLVRVIGSYVKSLLSAVMHSQRGQRPETSH